MQRWLFRQSKITISAVAIGPALLIAEVDYLTGYEISLGAFYLFPIFLVAWGVSRRSAMVFAISCAILWRLADVGAGHPYRSPAIGYWNTAVRLGYFCSVAFLAGRLKEEQDLQKNLARFDSLTNLPNRRGFLEAADIECHRAQRTKSPLTLAYIDLDNFKTINDQYGHSMGDEVLRVVGHALRGCSRASDTAGRLGGDEFAILLRDSHVEGAKVFLETMRGHLLKAMEGRQWSVTFSIGSISFTGDVTVDEMIRRADTLMYEVKHSNKGAINFDRSSGDFYTQGIQTV